MKYIINSAFKQYLFSTNMFTDIHFGLSHVHLAPDLTIAMTKYETSGIPDLR